MRRYRMPELQEASENMLFCPAEVCHLGTAGRSAEHGDKAHDKQFAKVVTRVVGPGIGDVVDGDEKGVHAGNGLQKGDPHPRIHPRQNSNTPQIRSNPKRDSPDSSDSSRLGSGGNPQLLQQRDQMSRPGPGFRKQRGGGQVTIGPQVMLCVAQCPRQTCTAQHGG